MSSARLPHLAWTVLAGWAIAFVLELALVVSDASLLAHVPFGDGASAAPALGFVLELAYLQAALAPLACVVRSVWLFARARGPSPRVTDALAARLRAALRGLGLGAGIGAWLATGLATGPWPAPWAWLGVGVTIAALVVLPLALASLLDAAAPFVAVEGVIDELLELRPHKGSPSHLVRIGSERWSVPRSVWDATARGERVRVVTYGFTGLFLRLEKLEGSGVTST